MLHELLKTHFGYDQFRPLQAEIITTVLEGQDALVLMPTGGGKSLCYQLPALALPGVTLVISPLIALMKDQVDGLQANGVAAMAIHSGLAASEISQIQKKAISGHIKLLYVSPERLALPVFQEFLEKIEVSLLAIDEAHCISEWGHDFRPDYRNLKQLRKRFLGVPVIALTATATEKVRTDIKLQLGLEQAKVFLSTFNRPNLTYEVRPKAGGAAALRALVGEFRGQSVIIYCQSRKDVETLAASFTKNKMPAVPYHAGLQPGERQRNQDRFIRDEVPIVVATIAFGMGIDKPDVRLVVHYDLPKSLEGYYQETGRAGRDGLASRCVLFYTYADAAKQEYFIEQITDAKEQGNAQQKLHNVLEYCQLTRCRRAYLMRYFAEEWTDDACGNCDNCLKPPELVDSTEIAKKIISAVLKTNERFGAGVIAGVLLGQKTVLTKLPWMQSLSVFGIVDDFSEVQLKSLIRLLAEAGLLLRSTGEYPTFQVSHNGKRFLLGSTPLLLPRPQVAIKSAKSSPLRSASGPYDMDLFEQLRVLRKRLADELGVPPFIVFGDASLRQMAISKPSTIEQFAAISGVGEKKLQQFGEVFIAEIQSSTGEKTN